MFTRWFQPKNKFSLENLKYLYSQLLKYNNNFTDTNKESIIEILRSIAELIIYGDQHNSNFFDYFCEKNIISYFIHAILKVDSNLIKIQLLQTLSILIQNINNQNSLYYLFSNNYINNLIIYRFDFSDEELLAYYISFLKTLSLKLNNSTVQFFFNETANDFPLYTHCLQFFNHNDLMVRIAVRTLTLNVYRVAVDYDKLRTFILNSSAVPYFSNLVWFIKAETISLSSKLNLSNYLSFSKLSLTQLIESVLDNFYYLDDILQIGDNRLNEVLTDQLLSHLLLPLFIKSVHTTYSNNVLNDTPIDNNITKRSDNEGNTNNSNIRISKCLSLYLFSQIFLIIHHHSGLLNSILVSLFNPRPPLLALNLINEPPQYAVKTEVPIVSILFPKGSSNNDNVKNRSYPKTSSKKDKYRNLSAQDENSKPLSAAAPPPPVSSPIQSLGSHYKERSNNNIYRIALFNSLNEGDDNVIVCTIALILSIIRNPLCDHELLIEAGICSHRFAKQQKLLSSLLSNTDNDDDDVVVKKENTNQVISVLSTPDNNNDINIDTDNSKRHDSSIVNQYSNLSISSPQVSHRNSNTVISSPLKSVSDHPLSFNDTTSPLSASLSTDQLSPIRESSQSTTNKGASIDIVALFEAAKAGEITLSAYTPPGTVKNNSANTSFPADYHVNPDSEVQQDIEKKEEKTDSAPTIDSEISKKDNIDTHNDDTSCNIPSTSNSNIKADTAPLHTPLLSPVSSTNRKSINPSNNDNTSNYYNDHLISCLLLILSSYRNNSNFHYPIYRFITLKLASELLVEIMYDPTSSDSFMHPEHHLHLQLMYLVGYYNLLQYHHRHHPLYPLFIETFFDFFHKDYIFSADLINILHNSMILMPVTSSAISGYDFDYRLPSGELEILKISIKYFLLLHQVICKLAPSTFDSQSSISSSNVNYKIGDEIEITLQYNLIPLLLLTSTIPIPRTSSPPPPSIQPASSYRRQNVFAIVLSRQLLLVEQHPRRLGYAIVMIIVNINDIGMEKDPKDELVLHLRAKSTYNAIFDASKTESNDNSNLNMSLPLHLTLQFSSLSDCLNFFHIFQDKKMMMKIELIESILEYSQHIEKRLNFEGQNKYEDIIGKLNDNCALLMKQRDNTT